MTSSRLRLFVLLTRNALLEYLRDPLTNIFTFIMPITFFAIFAITSAVTGGSKSAEARVWQFAFVDSANNADASELRQTTRGLRGVNIIPMSAALAAAQLTHGEVQAVITIPAGWTTTGDRAIPVKGYAVARLAVEDALTTGANVRTSQLVPIQTNFTEVEPIGRNYFQFTITGLLSLALLQLGLYGTASPLLASKRNGVFRRYSLTPMPIAILMVSHVSVRLLIAMLQVAVLTTAAVFLTGLQLDGGLFELGGVTIVGAIALISLGYLMGGAFKRYNLGLLGVLVCNFYLLLFGQIFADFKNVFILKWLVYLNPLSYVSDAFRHVFLGSRPELLALWVDFIALGLWAALFLTVGIYTFTFEARTQ